MLNVEIYESLNNDIRDDGEKIDFDWSVEQLNELEFLVQLNFVTPLKISNDQELDFHIVGIEFLETKFYSKIYEESIQDKNS